MPNMFGGDQLSEDYAPWFHEDVIQQQERVLGKPTKTPKKVEVEEPSVRKKTRKIVTTKHVYDLDAQFIRQALAMSEDLDIPDNARVFVRVPGGGDWSNTDLDIEDAPIQVYWEETTEEE